MEDAITAQRIKETHPKAQPFFIDFINECETVLNITLRIMEPVTRSIEQQNYLYKQGRSLPGKIVTNSQGGQSFHNYGLAIDLCEIDQGGKVINWNYDMKQLTPIAKKYGIEWGGDWHTIQDRPHFQKTFSYKWQDLYKKYQKQETDGNGWINL